MTNDEEGAEQSMERYGLMGETLERMAPRRLDAKGVAGADHALLTRLAERHLTLLPTGNPDEAAKVLEMSAQHYLDPAIFAREKRAIFDRVPVVAGLSQDIPKAGDYITVDDLDTPIFVTRTKSGAVKAFVNSCRHRGAALIHDKRGQGRHSFTCPYHGWSYDEQGTLYGVPCASAFDGLDKAKHSLIEVPCAETSGILFVSPRADVPLDLDAHLGPELLHELSFWGFDKVSAARSEPIVLPGNWKLVYDTFLEAYHFAAAHKNNLANFFNSNVQTVDTFGKHIRISVSYRGITEEYAKAPPETRVPENYLLVAYVLFPGMVLINSTQVLEVFRIFPKSVDETIVQHACYSRLPLDADDNAELFEMIWQSAHNIVQNEDFPFGVTTAQRALRSGSLKTLVFGKNELPIHINYQSIADCLAAAN